MTEDYSRSLWAALGTIRTGMLGLAAVRHPHSQPMTAHFDDESGTLFFYGPADGALAGAARDDHDGVFHYAGPDHAVFACLHGALTVSDDLETKRRFWSDEVARWFPGGPDDDAVTLLRFDADRAQVWLSGPDHQEVTFARPADRRDTVRL